MSVFEVTTPRTCQHTDKTRVIKQKIDGFTVRSVNDGCDYWDILARFKRGEIPCDYERIYDIRSVHVLNVKGRRIVLKFDATPIKYWECKLSRLVQGPIYSRIMKKSNHAVDQGCDIIQRVYMVAEKMEWGLARESVIMLDYMEGMPLDTHEDYTPYKPAILKTMLELHKYRLAFIDAHPGNFIVGPDGELTVIDLSFRDSFRMGRAKDVLRMKELYDIDMETHSLSDKFMIKLVSVNRYIRNLSRRIRKHRKAILPK